MELTKINEILSDLINLKSRYVLISSDKSGNYHEEKSQGAVGMLIEIYNINEENVFLKVLTESDSYGYNERVTSVQFVSAKTKEVVVYE